MSQTHACPKVTICNDDVWVTVSPKKEGNSQGMLWNCLSQIRMKLGYLIDLYGWFIHVTAFCCATMFVSIWLYGIWTIVLQMKGSCTCVVLLDAARWVHDTFYGGLVHSTCRSKFISKLLFTGQSITSYEKDQIWSHSKKRGGGSIPHRDLSNSQVSSRSVRDSFTTFLVRQ